MCLYLIWRVDQNLFLTIAKQQLSIKEEMNLRQYCSFILSSIHPTSTIVVYMGIARFAFPFRRRLDRDQPRSRTRWLPMCISWDVVVRCCQRIVEIGHIVLEIHPFYIRLLGSWRIWDTYVICKTNLSIKSTTCWVLVASAGTTSESFPPLETFHPSHPTWIRHQRGRGVDIEIYKW